MESCKFPYTYTIISGLFDDVNNSKRLNFESCRKKKKKKYMYYEITAVLHYHQNTKHDKKNYRAYY